MSSISMSNPIGQLQYQAIQKLLRGRRQPRRTSSQGFTLVELMVVIVIVGILSAIALPRFMGVKDKAKINVQIGEGAGLAKECAAAIISEGPYPKNYASLTPASGLTISGNCNDDDVPPGAPTAETETITFETEPAKGTEGVKCPGFANALTANQSCMVTVHNASTGDYNPGDIQYTVQ